MEFRLRRLVVSILLLCLICIVILLKGGPSAPPGPTRPEEGDPGGSPDSPIVPDPGAVEGGVIEGRVERRGRGTAARVEARIDDRIERHPAARTADAGPSGHFRIEGLPPGRYELRAVAADRAAGEAMAEIPVAGARVRVRIEIPAGEYTLAARAVWANGAPFLGLVRRDAWIRTDADGRFRIRGLGPGTHPLVFLLPGHFRSGGHEVVVPTQRERVFVVDFGAVAIRGRVVDATDETPVTDARITAGGGDALFCTAMSQRVRTDAEGRFRVRVPSKYRSLRIEAAGFRSMWFWPDPESDEEAVVRLDRTITVTGRVETEKGDPVPGVPVFAVETGAWVRTPTARAVSGEDGRFAMEGVCAENVVIYARGGGWISNDLAAALTGWYASLPRTLGTGNDAEVILVVVEASRIEGTVTDGAGRPVAGALVLGVPWFTGGIPSNYRFREGIRTKVATDTDGRFRILDAVPTLQHDLTVTAPGFLPVKVRTSPPPAGGAVGATIVLSSGRSLSVRTVWAGSDAPVADAAIVAATEKGPHFKAVAKGTTDVDGRATVGPLPATGLIRLEGRHAGGRRPPPGANFANGPPEEEVLLTFHPGLALAGRVVFPDGTPAPHGRVQVWSSAGRHYAPIAAGGRFRVPDLPPGRFRVVADAMLDGVRRVATFSADAGNEDLEIVLTESDVRKNDDYEVTVRILDPQGRPVPRAETTYVVLSGRDNDPGQGWIQVYGGVATLEFDRDSRRYWLAVSDARTFSGARLPLGRVLLGPLTRFEGELIVRLPPEKTINGVVVDEAGRGIPGAGVSYQGLADAGATMHIRTERVFADGHGRFRIGGLGEGEYIVHSGSADLLGARVVVPAGGTDVVLVLRRPTSARVRVVDATGAGVKGCGVEVRGNWFGGPKGVTNEEGVVVLGGLSPGSRSSLHVNATPPVTIDPWLPKDTTVRLPKPLGIAGRVVDVRGEPVSEAQVWGRPDGMDWLDTSADGEGRFSFTGLPPGMVTLIAEAENLEPDPSDSRAVRVAAGSKGVRLVQRPGVTMRLRIAEWPADLRRGVDANLIAASGEIVASELIEEDGTVEIRGLDAKSAYSLWIEALDDGRTVWRSGLRPGPDPITIGLEAGGLIRGTLIRRGPVEVDGLRLVAPGIGMDATLFADGRFEIAGVPSGSFEVVAEGWIDGRRVRTVVPARRGETVELTIGE